MDTLTPEPRLRLLRLPEPPAVLVLAPLIKEPTEELRGPDRDACGLSGAGDEDHGLEVFLMGVTSGEKGGADCVAA